VNVVLHQVSNFSAVLYGESKLHFYEMTMMSALY